MQQELQRTTTDCGWVAMLNAAQKAGYIADYEKIKKAFGDCVGHPDFRSNLQDSPWHHEQAMIRLQFCSKVITEKDILDRRCNLQHIVVLLHDPKNPTLSQHWANIDNMNDSQITIAMNSKDKPFWTVSREFFVDLYRKGFPNCAYEIGVGIIRGLPWYSRWWLKLTSWL